MKFHPVFHSKRSGGTVRTSVSALVPALLAFLALPILAQDGARNDPPADALSDTFLFDQASVALSPPEKAKVQRLAVWLRDSAEADADGKVLLRVDGHTSDRGAESVNLEISERRAEAVRLLLIAASGLPAERFAVHGFGESQPQEALDGNESTEERERKRALNRRVVVRWIDGEETEKASARRPALSIETVVFIP